MRRNEKKQAEPKLSGTEEALLAFVRDSRKGFGEIQDPIVAEKMFRVLIGEGKGPLALTTRLVYSPHAERLLPILFERYRKNWRVRFAIITRLVRFWRCDVLDEGSLEFFELDSLIPDLTARERALIDSQC